MRNGLGGGATSRGAVVIVACRWVRTCAGSAEPKKDPDPPGGAASFNVSVSKLPGTLYRRTALIQ